MNKIELHWDTRNEYVLIGNELKSLEEKHRRELERRKKEEEEKKKKTEVQISDLQSRGGISQNFVSNTPINRQGTSLKIKDNKLQANSLDSAKDMSLGKNSSNSINNLNKNNSALQRNALNPNNRPF